MVSKVISRSESNPLIEAKASRVPSLNTKTQSIARSIFVDLAQGLAHSRLFRGIAVAAIAAGTLVALANPAGWVIAAVTVSAFALGLISSNPAKTKQYIAFEISAINRLRKTNYHPILERNGAKLFLGALPNRLSKDEDTLTRKEGVQAILSVNESWERSPMGLSLPVQPKDWKRLHVDFKGIDVKDHSLLNDDALNQGADFIKRSLDENKSTYVHCRAGKGRSAMVIAAYLIKHENKSVDEACALIKEQRPCSTIMKKKIRLNDYRAHLNTARKPQFKPHCSTVNRYNDMHTRAQ